MSILKESLLHIPKSNYAYGYNEKVLHIRLRSKKGDLEKATLRIGDPYMWEEIVAAGNLNSTGQNWSGGKYIPMKKEVETELFDYWIAECKPENNRSRYCFVVEKEDEKLLYTEKKIIDLSKEENYKELSNIENFFGYPYLNKIDIPKPPKWVKDTIWYQIFPDRFANGNPNINPINVEPWGSKPTHYNYTGGDLQGIIDHLDYLEDLGVTGIYLCPITKGNTNHRYDTIDYMEIDPYLGDKQTLKNLVEELHSRGMKIMLDAVFNHIGYYSNIWQDVIKNKEESKYKDWFYIKDMSRIDTPLKYMNKKNIPYETFGCVAEMPKLNTENPEVVDYLIEVGKYWVREFDIDGWRLDVSNEVDHRFWRKFREEVKKEKQDVYILGEIWHNSLPWLMGDQFDSVMNYPLTNSIRDFFCIGQMNAEEFKYSINNVNVSYPRQVNEVTFNLVGSHDTTRMLTFAGGNIEKLKLAYLFMFTQSGCPCIYYGDEVGMEGLQTPKCEGQRKCMVWDEDKQNKDILDFIKDIIQIRKENDDFKIVNNEWILTDKYSGLLIFKKGKVTVIINNSSKEVECGLPKYLKNIEVYDLFNKTNVKLEDNIGLKANGFLVLKDNNILE